MLDIYSKRMKEKGIYEGQASHIIKETLERYMGRRVDVFLSAQEAVDWGLADEIFDGDWKGLLR